MEVNFLSSTIHFQQLSDSEKSIVAQKIIEKNELVISIPAFVKKASRNFLILRKNGHIEKFVSIGLKDVSVKLKESLILEAQRFKSGPFWSQALILFFQRLQVDELLERGWATNLTGVRGSLASLSNDFDQYLASLGKDRSFTFCTVVSENNSGNISARESGYTCVGDFKSPFSEHQLNLYCWI